MDLLNRVTSPTALGLSAYSLLTISSLYLLRRDVPALFDDGTLAELFGTQVQQSIGGLDFTYDFLTAVWPLLILALVYFEALCRQVTYEQLQVAGGTGRHVSLSLPEALYVTKAASVFLTIVVLLGLCAHAGMFIVAVQVILPKGVAGANEFFSGSSSMTYVMIIITALGVSLFTAFAGLALRRPAIRAARMRLLHLDIVERKPSADQGEPSTDDKQLASTPLP